MTLTRPLRIAATSAIWLVSLILLLQISSAQAAPAATVQAPQSQSRLLLPSIASSGIPADEKLCRLGVGGTSAIAAYPIRALRLGWYLDWTTTPNPARPDDIAYHPMIRLAQVGLDAYTSEPPLDDLPQIVAGRRGALWFIGNEPDRVAWQDSIEPGLYARAYHDLYFAIKQADPTAQVAIGAVVQPTPLRLQYLDKVLHEYERLYGRPAPDEPAMPVDVWNIHAFILQERSCVAYPADCWGAEIPPGVDATEGMLYTIDDHDSLVIFKGFIETFRQWMADRGYRDRPLILTEFGILMPEDYGFGPARVNAFMSGAFEFLNSATGPNGYAPDNNRLVQSWAWYSLDDDLANGRLFDASTRQRTVFGDNFAALAARIPGDVNLQPIRASAARQAGSDAEQVTLSLTVANNGNSAISGVFGVKFYRGNPAQGGTPIGGEQFVYVLEGCGTISTVAAIWNGAPSLQVDLWAVVDPSDLVAERNEADNAFAFTLPAK